MNVTSVRSPAVTRPIRVMVVDDAAVVRGLLGRWIEAEPGLEVVAAVRNGREAIALVGVCDPDVVILDIDMPEVDGLAALPALLRKRPDLIVIMASTLTRRNAEISLRALALGAADYIPKPQTAGEGASSSAFRAELIERIRALHGQRRLRTVGRPHAPEPAPVIRRGAGARNASTSPAIVPAAEPAAFRLRPFPVVPPRVLVIGASTGGPQALCAVIGRLNGVIDQAPVLVVQHMPATFTTVLAEHLARASGRAAAEAVHGEPVLAGRIYIAPGGRHMRVVRCSGTASITLDDDPPINFCRPALDPMFASAAEVWGFKTLAVVLTGMGSDGARGAGAIVAAGGSVIAQNEASSVVWGMPAAVAHAGLCSSVLPVEQIAPRIVRLFAGGRP